MKNIKEIYESKINKEDIYNKVIEKIENRNEKYKISLVILLIGGIMLGIRIVFINDYKIYVESPNNKGIDELANKVPVIEANQDTNKNGIEIDKMKDDILKILDIIMGDEVND